MSDSDSELLTTNNVFTFQNKSETITAQGPGINVTGMNFPDNNVTTSILNMPRHEWRRRPGSSYDQRSIGYRRETSPLSVASACDARQRNFNGSYYARVSSQRSVYNDRAGSPMSMRSMDSNATMCATDIATALKNMQFNNNDTMIIREAFNRFMKQKSNRRRRIEKRRNLRLVKHMRSYNRRKSGYDSGELGSNSSISSDDNRSVRTSNNKSNKSSYISNISNLRRIIKESKVTQDRSDEFRQNTLPRMAGEPGYLNSSRASVTSTKSVNEKPTFTKSMHTINFRAQTQNAITQKERFKNGFLLPSHRFNRSVATTSIPEGSERHFNAEIKLTNLDSKSGNFSQIVHSSEDEEIFTEKTKKDQFKRGIDTVDDICSTSPKKAKAVSPCKNMTQSFRSSTIIEDKNDFDFAKPAFPVKKATNLKAKAKLVLESVIKNGMEKLISSSRHPISDTIESIPTKTISQSKEVQEKEDTGYDTLASQSTTELSMRPSFIKRKLFTQNLNVTEKTQDAANSPQNSIYGSIQKEKNKARKLATSQYCLRRDIQADENNVLDLIHKIIPAEQMNATNQTTKTIQNKSEVDKWDMSSIISTKNNDDDMSDTFTDEDTLHPDAGIHPALHATLRSPPQTVVNTKSVKVNVEANKVGKNNGVAKVAEQRVAKLPTKVTQVLAENNGTPGKVVNKRLKIFWETDFESDAEGFKAPKYDSKENKKSDAQQKGFSSMFSSNETSAANNTTTFNSTVDKFSIINRGLKLCSHRNTKPYTKKAANVKEDIRSHFESQNKKTHQTIKASSCIDLSMQDNDEQNKIERKKNLKPVTKKLTPKKRKTNEEKRLNTSPVKSQKKITTASTRINLSVQDDVEQNVTKQGSIKTAPKPRKSNKENNSKTSKVSTEKELTILQKTTLKADKKPTPLHDETNLKRKLTSNKKLPAAKDERQRVEDEIHKSETQNNKKKHDNNPEKNKKIEKAQALTMKPTVSSKNVNKKAENKQLKTTDDKRNTIQNVTSQMTLSDSADNNSSQRPLRSCRISKVNLSRMSLRSGDSHSSSLSTTQSTKTTKNVAHSKPINKLMNKPSQHLEESDISFSIPKDSPSPKRNKKLYKTRLQTSIESQATSVDDKPPPVNKQCTRNSTDVLRQLSITLLPLNNKDFININRTRGRSFRSRMAARRFLS